MANRTAGKYSKIIIGSTTLGVVTAELNCETGSENVTDTLSSGFYESTFTIRKASGSFEGKWKATLHPSDSTLTVLEDGQEAIVKYFVNATDTTPYFLCNTAKILKVNTTLPAEGVVTYKVEWEASGTFTIADEDGIT